MPGGSGAAVSADSGSGRANRYSRGHLVRLTNGGSIEDRHISGRGELPETYQNENGNRGVVKWRTSVKALTLLHE